MNETFYVQGNMHHNCMSINVQQDATIHSLFYMYSALHVGCLIHPLSGAQITVGLSTASGKSQLVSTPPW